MTNTELEQLVKSGALKSLTWTAGTDRKGPQFTAQYEGQTLNVTARCMTSYKMNGRLRVPGGTRYQYQVEVEVGEWSTRSWYTIQFGAVVGEGSEGRARIDAKKAKIAATTAKYLGLDINNNYRV